MPTEVANKVKAMIRGTLQYTSPNLGFNMLMSRLVRRYKASPTPAELDACFAEVRAFMEKYHSIMEPEYPAIAKA